MFMCVHERSRIVNVNMNISLIVKGNRCVQL
jgi:hypothetical protein